MIIYSVHVFVKMTEDLLNKITNTAREFTDAENLSKLKSARKIILRVRHKIRTKTKIPFVWLMVS